MSIQAGEIGRPKREITVPAPPEVVPAPLKEPKVKPEREREVVPV